MCKYFFTLLVILFFLILPEVVFCEVHIDSKIGYFIPSSSAMMDIYGSSRILAADFIFWENTFGLSIGLDSFSKDGTPYTYGTAVPAGYSASSNITRTNVSITGLYRFGNPKKSYPYIGFGIDSAKFDEKMQIRYQGSITNLEGSVNGTGAHFVAGIDIKADIASIFLEFLVSSIPFEGIEDAAGTDADGGGVTLYAGIRF